MRIHPRTGLVAYDDHDLAREVAWFGDARLFQRCGATACDRVLVNEAGAETMLVPRLGSNAIRAGRFTWHTRLDEVWADGIRRPTLRFPSGAKVEGFEGAVAAEADVAVTLDPSKTIASVIVGGVTVRTINLPSGVFKDACWLDPTGTWLIASCGPDPALVLVNVSTGAIVTPVCLTPTNHYTPACIATGPTAADVWVMYQTDFGLVVQKALDPTYRYELAPPGTPIYAVDACVIDGLLTVVYATDPAESRSGQRTARVAVQTLLDLEPVPLPPPVVVKPIGPLGPSLPNGTVVDLAPFFRVDDRCWPRGDRKRGDTHGMDMQLLPSDGPETAYRWWHRKFDSSGAVGELLSIDNDPNGWVHLRADCSFSQRPPSEGGPFIDTWTDTRWLRKTMRVGETIVIRCERIWRDPKTGTEIGRENYTKEMQLLNVWERYWGGEDAGWGRCIEYRYNVERYREFIGDDGRVWGWGDWDYTDPGTGKMSYSRFWLLGGAPQMTVQLPNFPLPRRILEEPRPMKLPTDVQATIRAFAAINPLPQGDGSEAWLDSALRFGWLKRCVETVVFFHGGDYGQKRRGGGAPISAGRIARREPGGFRDWDILISAGAGTPRLDVNVDSEGLITDQEFVPVAPVNHLVDQKPRPGRAPWSADAMHGVSGFDVAARVHGGDLSYYAETAPLPLNNFVYATIDHPQTHRINRTFSEGLRQTETLCQRLAADNRRALHVMLCGPANRDGVKLTRAQALDMIRQEVALFNRYPQTVLGLAMGNELYQQGFEADFMLDPTFWSEVEALIPLQFPFAIGQVGDAVVFGPGSFAAMHPDRGKSSADALQILAGAQARDGRTVVAREPARIEAGGSGQSRGDINFVREELANAKRLGLPYFLHLAAGRGCYVPAMDSVQHEALALIKAEARVAPIPPQGHPILDFDMSDHVGFYRLFISKRREIEALAVAWYTKSRGHAPAESDISHGFYWRSMREWSWFGTLRRAFEDTWPGGAPTS